MTPHQMLEAKCTLEAMLEVLKASPTPAALEASIRSLCDLSASWDIDLQAAALELIGLMEEKRAALKP